MTMKTARGLLLVNTGNGKGKSTAAFGVAFRAIGHGLSVSIIQFIKGKWKTGELESAQRLGLELIAMGKGFTWESDNIEEDKALMRQAWTTASEKILSGNYDLIILDELNYVLGYGYIPVDDVIRTLRSRPPHVHVILTGRNAPDEIVLIADCVTEMRDIKHPYRNGIPAQRGIDF
jgi:cob(I)alamin adenosyltransferase